MSQGAAPVGREVTITAAEGNVIHELAGPPGARDRRADRRASCPTRERALIVGGLLIGIVIDGGKPDYEQGDFLVRGVLGADLESGSLAVGTQVRPGQVRARPRPRRPSADEDLRRALRLRLEAMGRRAARRGAPVLLQRARDRDVRRARP